MIQDSGECVFPISSPAGVSKHTNIIWLLLTSLRLMHTGALRLFSELALRQDNDSMLV